MKIGDLVTYKYRGYSGKCRVQSTGKIFDPSTGEPYVIAWVRQQKFRVSDGSAITPPLAATISGNVSLIIPFTLAP